VCDGQDVERFVRHLGSTGLPVSIGEIAGARPRADELLARMAHDKKARDGRLTFVLVRGIGKAFVANDVPLDLVRKVLSN
jgi:3-dehydroquinate synthetase